MPRRPIARRRPPLRRDFTRAAAAGVAFALFTAAGCVERRVEGDASEYAMATYGVVLTVAAMLGLGAFFWLMLGRRWRWTSYGVAAMCLAGSAFAASGAWADRVRIGADAVVVSTGTWFAPTRAELRFDRVAAVTVRSRQTHTRQGGRQIHRTIAWVDRDGVPGEWRAGAAMDAALPELVERLRRRGVEVREEWPR